MPPAKKTAKPHQKISPKKETRQEITPEEKVPQGFNWYPGHMARAMREIKEKVKMVDIVFEIRDARVPLVSGNNALDELLRQKSRLILFNKANLSDPAITKSWESWFEKQDIPFLFINCFDKPALKKVMKLARDICHEKRVSSGVQEGERKKKLRLMIIGLPNTGKSTLINELAGRNATKVADVPGQTQVQLWIKIDDELELLDTPGVMPSYFLQEEHGLWLSMIHAIPDDLMGEERPALFLVNYFLEKKSPIFKERYKLDSLEISAEEALMKIATVRGCLKQKGQADWNRVYKLILQDFRKGDLGKVSFESPPLRS